MKEKACQQMSLLTRSEKHYLPTACRFYSPEERKEKSCCLCACYLLFNPRYQRQDNWRRRRFLVADFFLPVIKPPGTYFHNKLLPSCWSSKFSSSFPATSVLLSAPLDPVRPDRNPKSAWRQSVLIFRRQTLHRFFVLASKTDKLLGDNAFQNQSVNLICWQAFSFIRFFNCFFLFSFEAVEKEPLHFLLNSFPTRFLQQQLE